MMKRLIGIALAILVALILAVPVALAADPSPGVDRILVSTEGDFSLPAGEHADAVIVIGGTATIEGEVDTLVVVDGALNLVGARAQTVMAIRSPVEVGPDTVVAGDVFTLDALVRQTGNAEVLGKVTDLPTMLVGIGAVLAPALLLLWIGFGLAMLAAGLLLAGLASRQVQQAETVISREPVLALVSGLVGMIAFPVAAVLLIITVIGAPLGVSILFQVWPLVALIGYLVAGIWLGNWVLRRSNPERMRERPYLAAVVGLVLLGAMGLIPILAIATAVASLFGFGAVIVLVVRTLRGYVPQPSVPGHQPAPTAI